MKCISFIGCLFLLVGCTTPAANFFNNEPVAGYSIVNDINIKLISDKSDFFRVYSVNADYTAIVKSGNLWDSNHINELRDATIIDKEQLSKLKIALKNIEEIYALPFDNSTRVVDYSLIKSNSSLRIFSKTLITDQSATSNAQIIEGNNIIFRIQFVRENESINKPKKIIKYLEYPNKGLISFEELKKFSKAIHTIP